MCEWRKEKYFYKIFILQVQKREGAMNHTPLYAFGGDTPYGVPLVSLMFHHLIQIVMQLKKIEALTLSKNFGTKNADGFENRVLKAVWSEGASDNLVTFVGERSLYTGNITLPQGRTYDQAGLDAYKAEIQEALDENKLKVYGFLLSVNDLSGKEFSRVKNVSNGHIIGQFPRAWHVDDLQEIAGIVRNDMRKALEKGTLERVNE